MIAKQFLADDFEILITQNDNGSYNVIKKVHNKESDFYSGFDYESASDLFDILLKGLENDD